jgi:AmpD protein
LKTTGKAGGTRPTVDAAGWYGAARRVDSPHYDARPDGVDASLLVLHNISLPAGQFGGPYIEDLFTGRLDVNADPSFADLKGVRVSAHFLIRRDGSVIQFVPTVARAWHAGQSHFDGRDACNDFSVGIELEGSDDVAFSPAQYAALLPLTLAIAARHPVTDVLGHEHIAPDRKTDPGPHFAWQYYADALVAEQQQRAKIDQKNSTELVHAYRPLRIFPANGNVNMAHVKK